MLSSQLAHTLRSARSSPRPAQPRSSPTASPARMRWPASSSANAGMHLTRYLRPRLFDLLGIGDVGWHSFPPDPRAASEAHRLRVVTLAHPGQDARGPRWATRRTAWTPTAAPRPHTAAPNARSSRRHSRWPLTRPLPMRGYSPAGESAGDKLQRRPGPMVITSRPGMKSSQAAKSSSSPLTETMNTRPLLKAICRPKSEGETRACVTLVPASTFSSAAGTSGEHSASVTSAPGPASRHGLARMPRTHSPCVWLASRGVSSGTGRPKCRRSSSPYERRAIRNGCPARPSRIAWSPSRSSRLCMGLSGTGFTDRTVRGTQQPSCAAPGR